MRNSANLQWDMNLFLKPSISLCSHKTEHFIRVCSLCGCSPYLGPKHMQRLARYPLEKEKKIMKMMYQASCSNHTVCKVSRGWTLQNMKRGMKTTRRPTRMGSQMLSLPGYEREMPRVKPGDRKPYTQTNLVLV